MKKYQLLTLIQQAITTCMLLLSIGMVRLASAQELTGEVDGTVLDSSGAAVANATVTVKNTDQNLVLRTLHTNAQGQFTASLLPLAHYAITIEAPGFQTSTHAVETHTGVISSVNFAMVPGTVSQQVTVSTEDVTIEPQLDSAAAGTLIPSTKITQLSLSSRNFVQLLVIQPGVSDGIPGGTQDRGAISTQGGVNSANYEVNGIPPQYNGFFLDGQDLQRRSAGGTQIGAYPGIDFIQEMNLLRSNFSAQFGGSGSAFVNIASRTGNTAFHGSAYEFYRSQIFNANTFFNNYAGVPRPLFRYSDFGYALSGPLWIPKITSRSNAKTFFVFGQEFLRSESTVQTTLTNVPTLAQRQGMFASTVCTSYMASGACANAGVTSITTIDPTAQAYLTDVINKFPAPNSPSDPQGLIVAEPGINNETQTFARIDHQFNDKFSIMFRFFNDPFNVLAPYGLRSNAQPAGTGTANVTDGDRAYYGSGTWVVSTSNVLQAGGGYLRSYVTAQATGTLLAANSPDVHPVLPLNNTTGRIPNLSIVSAYATISPYTNGEPQTQIFANDTQTLGRHTISSGFNLEWQKAGNNVATTNAGAFTFSSTALPMGSKSTTFQQAFANFLDGSVTSFAQVSPDPSVYLHANVYEAYLQDDYHASKDLTVDVGVRYSYIVSPSSGTLRGHPYLPFVNFIPSRYSSAQAPTIDTKGLICQSAPCNGGVTPNPNYNSYNGIIIANKTSPYGSKVYTQPVLTFAPRFGFSYDLDGKGTTAIRGGFGVYFLQSTTADYGSLGNSNQPNITNLLINNTNFEAPAAAVTNPTPQVVKAAQVNWQPPYTETYSLDLQHTFFGSMILDLGYYGNRVLHQPVNEDINQPLPGAWTTANLGITSVNATNTPYLNRIRPYLGYGPINSDIQNGVSNYNGLQTSVTKRFSGGSLVTVNYTYSRALTNAVAPENVYNPAAEYGPDGSNRVNIANANFVYNLPFFRGKHSLAAYTLGGWEFSGIVGFGSGQFLTATTGAVDTAGQGLLASGVAEGAERANYISNPNVGAPHALLQWFNKAAFASPAGTTVPGTSSNGSIIGPGYQDWDLSVFKNVNLWREANLQVRIESFNTFNHTNFSGISTTTTASNYGQVTSAGPNRVLQLGAKITF